MNRQMKTSSEVAIKHLQVTPLLFSTLGETLATPFFFWDSGFSDARDWKIHRTSNSNKAPFKIRSVWISKDHHGFTSWLGSKVTSWCPESDINSCWFLRFLPIGVCVSNFFGPSESNVRTLPYQTKNGTKTTIYTIWNSKRYETKQNPTNPYEIRKQKFSPPTYCVFLGFFGHPPTCWDPSPSDLVEANRWRPLHDARPHTLSTWGLSNKKNGGPKNGKGKSWMADLK